MRTDRYQLYSVWIGEEFIAVGTAEECSNNCNLSPMSIRKYALDPAQCKEYQVRLVGNVVMPKKARPVKKRVRRTMKTDISDRKKKAITAAEGLFYGQETIDKIEAAKTVAEISIIMASARKKKFGKGE